MPLRDILIFGVVFGTLPFIFFQPYIGILLFSWLSYMNPHRMSWGRAYDFPFAYVVAITLIISYLFTSNKQRLLQDYSVYTWLLFIFWVCVTTLFALLPDNAILELKRFIKVQIIIGLTICLINTPPKLKKFIWVIIISIGFFGVKGGIFTLVTGGSYMVLGPADSFITGNTEIGFSLVIILPLTYYLFLQTQNKWIKKGILISLGLIGFAIVGTFSRGAFLAGGMVGLYLWLKSSKKIITGFLVLIIISMALSFMPKKYFDKMKTIETYEEDASAMGRINAWYFAFNLANDRPVYGGGFGCFHPSLFPFYAPNPNDYHDAHSIYFEVLGEHGYIGLALFMLLGLQTWRNNSYVIKVTKEKPEYTWANDLARMLQVSFVGYASGGAFLGLAYFDLPYHLFAITVVLKTMVGQGLSKEKNNVEKHSTVMA